MDLSSLRITLLVILISLISSFTLFSPPQSTGSFSAFNGGLSNVVNEVAIAPNGDVYATGEFLTADGGAINVGGIAKWNGSSWSALGTGLDGSGRAMVFDSAGNLYVGGSFNEVNGLVVDKIAKWDGTSWSALGLGLNNGGTVLELEIDANDNLIVGGSFNSVDGVTCSNIAKWDGTSWSTFGSGLNNFVFGLDVGPNGDIYVCGNFTTAGGTPVNRIARWDGTSWSGMGNQALNSTVNEIVAAPNGKVYVSGNFTFEGSNAVNHIIEWDGTSWNSLDVGLNGPALALTSDFASNILVGGGFTTAGGNAANGVAMWDGTSWNTFSTGINGSLNSIDTDIVGDFVVGGNFSLAGGITANRIAKWSGVFLSVELNAFEAQAQDKLVHLNWKTSSEDQLIGFDIQRSPEGVNWSKIGFHESQGSSEIEQSYRFIDSNPLEGINYYRLVMKNLEGGVQVSEIRSVKTEKQEVVSVYPNPSTGVFQIEGNFSDPLPYQVFDVYGRVVQNGYLNQNYLDLKSLPDGHYFLSLLDSEPIRLMKQRSE